MASDYHQQRNYGGGGGGRTNVSVLTSRAAEVGRMGGVTPEIWDSVLSQMQQLVDENENLRKTLEANNYEMMQILDKKKSDVDDAHKLYWDARVSVLGFKAQIMKLNGEVDELREKQYETNLEKEKEQFKDEKGQLKHDKEALSRKFQTEIDDLKATLQQWKDRESKLTTDYHHLQEDRELLKRSYEEQIDQLRKSQQKTTPPVPRPRTNVIDTTQLQKKIDDLESQNRSLRDELSKNRSEYDSFTRQTGEEMRKLRRAEGELSELSEQLREKNREIEHLKRQQFNPHAEQTAERLREAESQVKQLTGQLRDKDGEMDRLRQQQFNPHAGQTAGKLREAEGQVRQLTEQLREKDREIDHLKQQKEMTSMADMNVAGGGGGGGRALTRVTKALNEEKGKSSRLEKEVSYLKDQMTSLQQQIDSQGGQTDYYESQVQTYKEEKDRLSNDLNKLARERDQLRQQLDEVDQSAHENYSELEQNYATLKDENAQLQVEYSTLRDQLQNEKERGHHLEVSLSQAESKIEYFKSNADTENSSWEGYMEEVEKEMKRVTDDLATIREKNRSLQADINTLTNERNSSVEEKARLTERLEKKSKECQEHIDQSVLWKEQFESARHDFDVEKKMRDKEAKAVDALRHNRDSLQKEVDELRRRVTEQQSVIASIDPSLVSNMSEGGSPRAPHSGGSPKNDRRGHSGELDRPKPEEGPRPYTHGPHPPLHERDRIPPHREPFRPQGGGPPGDDYKFRQQGGPRDDFRQQGGPRDDFRQQGGPRDDFRQQGGPRDDFRQQGGPRDDFRQGGPPRGDSRYREGPPGERGGPPPGDQRFRHQGGPPDDQRNRRPDDFHPGGGGRGGDYRSTAPLPQPYTPFTPLFPGGGRGSGGMNDLNMGNPPRQQSGGGELIGAQFNRRSSRDPMTTSPVPGRPGPPNIHPRANPPANQFPPQDHGSGMTPVRRPMPPDMGGGGGGAVPLPGEIPNTSKPTGNCPICGMGNFATQTDLELHAAKCDKFN